MARRLPPVEVPPRVPERLSMTLLSFFDRCHRSAYLHMVHDGGAPSHPMGRGSLYHLFQQRAMWTLIEHGEETLFGASEKELRREWEARGESLTGTAVDVLLAEAKSSVADHTAAIIDEILRDHPDLVVTRADVDEVREMAYHWAVGLDVSPGGVVGVEQKYVLDLPCGVRLSGKVDLLSDCGDVLQVDDAKTSFHMPGQEEFEDRFQLWFYCALVAFGRPVEKVPCPECGPHGGDRERPGDVVCLPTCRDGMVEVELEPVGQGINFFRAREVYPRYLGDDGLLRNRSMVIARTDLHDFVADLDTMAARFTAAVESGEWPAVPGDHCSMCPAAGECPLPAVLRDYAGTINTVEQASEALEKVELEKLRHAAIVKEVKNWAKRGGPVRVGRDLVYEWSDDEKRSTDYEALDAAVVAAVEYGEPFDMSRYRKTRVSTGFRRRKLKPEEMGQDDDSRRVA